MRWIGASIVGVLVFAFRYLLTGALENDHFVHLARAHQILHGAWPVRDFVDPGMPLQYLFSAAAAAVLGPSLFADVVLCALLLGAAAAITFALAYRASGSLAVAAVAAAVQMAALPRLYNAPKLFIHVVVIALGWWYADKPSAGRLIAAGAWTAVAFLFRHDHVAYAGAAMAALIVMCRWSEGRGAVARDLGIYAASVVACVTPWLVYVSWGIGLREYAASSVAFARAEANRTYSAWTPAFFAVLALPVFTAGLAWRKRTSELSFGHVSFACVLTCLLIVAFLRDTLSARLPDIAGPGSVVLASLLGLVVPPRRQRTILAAAVLAGLLAGTLAVARRPGITQANPWQRAVLVTGRLTRWPWTEALPSPELVALERFANECTEPRDHILVGWFAPEFAVVARRPFAGGHPAWVPGYYESPHDQALALERLARESVPLVLLSNEFAVRWTLIHRRLTSRPYMRRWAAEVSGRTVETWVDSSRPTFGADASTGLPCFVRR